LERFRLKPWIFLLVPLTLAVEAQFSQRKMSGTLSMNAADYVIDNVPEGTVFGAFNAGIFGACLSKNYVLINLDGVVNPTASKALRAKKLKKYLQECGIEYIIDNSRSVEYFSGFSDTSFFSELEIIRQFKSDVKYEIIMYKVGFVN